MEYTHRTRSPNFTVNNIYKKVYYNEVATTEEIESEYRKMPVGYTMLRQFGPNPWVKPKQKATVNQASTYMSQIFHKLWLPMNDYRKCWCRIMYPWHPTLDLLLLDEMLLQKNLYDDDKMSMKEYVMQKLSNEEYEMFTLLFWLS